MCRQNRKKDKKRKGKIVNARKKETHESHQQQIYAFLLFLEIYDTKSSTFVCFFYYSKFFFVANKATATKWSHWKQLRKKIEFTFGSIKFYTWNMFEWIFPCSVKVFLNEQESIFFYLWKFITFCFFCKLNFSSSKIFNFLSLMSLKLSLLQLKISFYVFCHKEENFNCFVFLVLFSLMLSSSSSSSSWVQVE